MYNLTNLTEEQVSIILQALQYYRYNNQYVTSEQWNIAETVVEKIDEIII
jgi:hypothetical protein